MWLEWGIDAELAETKPVKIGSTSRKEIRKSTALAVSKDLD